MLRLTNISMDFVYAVPEISILGQLKEPFFEDASLLTSFWLSSACLPPLSSIHTLTKDFISATDKVTQLNMNTVLYPFKVTNSQPYAVYILRKDQASITYTSQVQKISEVLSFIGGIIGAILGLLFILNSYTSFSF